MNTPNSSCLLLCSRVLEEWFIYLDYAEKNDLNHTKQKTVCKKVVTELCGKKLKADFNDKKDIKELLESVLDEIPLGAIYITSDIPKILLEASERLFDYTYRIYTAKQDLIDLKLPNGDIVQANKNDAVVRLGDIATLPPLAEIYHPTAGRNVKLYTEEPEDAYYYRDIGFSKNKRLLWSKHDFSIQKRKQLQRNKYDPTPTQFGILFHLAKNPSKWHSMELLGQPKTKPETLAQDLYKNVLHNLKTLSNDTDLLKWILHDSKKGIRLH